MVDDFRISIINDTYIKWLDSFQDCFDDTYFVKENVHKLKIDDITKIIHLKSLFLLLNEYSVKNGLSNSVSAYNLEYNNKLYCISHDGECYRCSIGNTKDNAIKYKNLKKYLSCNMETNFDLLEKRVIDSLNSTDLEYIRNELNNIKDATVVSGVGGSSVVSNFTSKVIGKKNKVITTNAEPRDFLYNGFNGFKNVIACSYSGNNYGVDMSFNNDMNKYLLSNNFSKYSDVTNLVYNTNYGNEISFISLASTLIPISIVLNYYLNGNNKEIINNINEYNYNFDTRCNLYEIFTGYDTSTASKYLESTMVEAGIGIPIIHDKYDYCHGRSSMCFNNNSNAIYYSRNTEFDRFMINELNKYYNEVIVIESKYKDDILDDYNMLIASMYLTKYISEKKNIDLSNVKYCPIVKKLYKYKGEI